MPPTSRQHHNSPDALFTTPGADTHLRAPVDRLQDIQPLAADGRVQAALEITQIAVALHAVAQDTVLDAVGNGLVGGLAGAQLVAFDGGLGLLLALSLLLCAHRHGGEVARLLVCHHRACFDVKVR